MSNSRIARRYARALFTLGKEYGAYLEYGRELDEFVKHYKQNNDFRYVISSPLFAMNDRKKILNAVLDKAGFSSMTRNFFNVLLDKNRMGSIESIIDCYSRLADEASNIVRAQIITAIPLEEETLDRVVSTFEGLISKSVRAEVIEDPDIIGGIIVRIGDTYWDGSIKAQIEGFRESFRRGE
ncbi:MAG: ATP synthase F1 subunit delta [Deltaproteobacteria bacterium]|nr:ATP synthase F1 subunit delta [Deltaproteobacteria bacterium]